VTSSGGRIWAQYVQQYTNISLYDYAVSGAVCSSIFADTKRSGIKEDQIPTFLADILFISNTTLKPIISTPADQTIYAIWIGTNDLGSGAFFTDKQPKNMTIVDYIDCVYTQLDRLYAIGARNFVLMNIAPLDLTPQYGLPQNGGLDAPQYWKNKLSYNTNITQSSEKMREYSMLVNALYDAKTPLYVRTFNRYPNSSFAVFDVHSLVS
jgi:phospholipase/lecithinase/hemolysin